MIKGAHTRTHTLARPAQSSAKACTRCARCNPPYLISAMLSDQKSRAAEWSALMPRAIERGFVINMPRAARGERGWRREGVAAREGGGGSTDSANCTHTRGLLKSLWNFRVSSAHTHTTRRGMRANEVASKLCSLIIWPPNEGAHGIPPAARLPQYACGMRWNGVGQHTRRACVLTCTRTQTIAGAYLIAAKLGRRRAGVVTGAM